MPQLKLPIIFLTVSMLLAGLYQLMNGSRELGSSKQKVATLSGTIEASQKIESVRAKQIESDNKRFEKKRSSQRKIKKQFSAWHQEVAKNAAKIPLKISACRISDDDFSVLIAAYNSTFPEAGLSASTGIQPLPAGTKRAAATKRLTGRIAEAEP